MVTVIFFSIIYYTCDTVMLGHHSKDPQLRDLLILNNMYISQMMYHLAVVFLAKCLWSKQCLAVIRTNN